MLKKVLLPLLIIPAFIFSCSKSDDVVPVASLEGTYKLEKLELVVDGNALSIPSSSLNSSVKFKSDGTVEVDDELVFFEGKYTYDATTSKVSFEDDFDPKDVIKSTVDIEKTSEGKYIFKTAKVSFDETIDLNNTTLEQELIFFSLFEIDEESATYKAFATKVGANPKDYSLHYTFAKQ
jgi:hypothetical protein